MPNRSPQTLWETALGQLELQVTRPNFETWLRNTVGLRLENNQLIVGVPSDFAVEWLRSRLSPLISRTVSQLFDSPISISFQVLGAQAAPTGPPSNGRQANSTPGSLPCNLNPQLTFESFTVVQTNRLAYRAARRVARHDASNNPLILFGPPGVGKTHLLHAIGHQARRASRQVLALTAEAFVDRYGQAVRDGHPHTFRHLFHDCDLFLLDDLPFLAPRSGSQEQFFHIFNSLHTGGCCLVLTTDTHPDTLDALSPRLRSRLQAGLTIELLSPPPDQLLEILRAKASRLSHPLPEPILSLIGQQPHTNIRELEGTLNRVVAFADLTDKPMSVEAAQQALYPLRPPQRQPSPNAILQAVCHHFHLPLDHLAGPSRARDITYARHIAMYLLRHHGTHPLAQIGHLLGGRDHSTVLNGCRRIKQELTSLPQTRTDIEQLETALQKPSAA